MNLTKNQVKMALSLYLEKNGSSIKELESELSTLKVEYKTAMSKEAAGGLMGGVGAAAGGGKKLLDLLSTFLKGVAGVGYGSLAVGGVGGLGLYGGYKALQDSDNKIDSKLQEKQKYTDATSELNELIKKKQTGMDMY